MNKDAAWVGMKVSVKVKGVPDVVGTVVELGNETEGARVEFISTDGASRFTVSWPYGEMSAYYLDDSPPQGVVVNDRFPHVCPYCKGIAYVTDFSIDHAHKAGCNL